MRFHETMLPKITKDDAEKVFAQLEREISELEKQGMPKHMVDALRSGFAKRVEEGVVPEEIVMTIVDAPELDGTGQPFDRKLNALSTKEFQRVKRIYSQPPKNLKSLSLSVTEAVGTSQRLLSMRETDTTPEFHSLKESDAMDTDFIYRKSREQFETVLAHVYPLSLRMKIKREANGAMTGGRCKIATVCEKYRSVLYPIQVKLGMTE